MTTIGEAIVRYPFVEDVLGELGIDPDWPKDSIVVTRRPECPTCAGGGTVAMADPDLSHEDVPEVCGTCQGTGYVPDPWGDADGCLAWLFVHGVVWVQSTHHAGVAEVAWGAADLDGAETAPTLHAALIAACKAVQERQS